MSFALFVVYLLMVFVRPAEHFAELRDVPFMEIASILALVGGALAILMGSRPPLRAGQVALLLMIVVWMAFSVAVTSNGATFEKVLGFVKSALTAFLLVILNVTTVRRVRVIAFVLTIPAIFLAVRTASDYQTRLEEVSRAHRGDLETEDANSAWDSTPEQTGEPLPKFSADDEFRVMNKGLFGDPNDLALTLIAILPFTIALRRKGALLRNALLVWLPVAVIVYGVYVTRSRGGVLALACVLGLLVRHRLGNSMSLVTAGIAVVGLLGAGFVGSRSMSMDQSAEGRVEMWSAGLQNLKGSPLWGIGYSNFDAVNVKAAHSAYVQCFAEIGMVGYVLWLGVLLLTLDELRQIHATVKPEDADLQHWARAIQVSLIGFLIGAIFLSRAYDVQLFILVGLGTAISDVARRRGYLKRGRTILTWIYIVVGAAFGSIVGYWLYMRVYF
jgi:hypothetical protein